MNFEQYFEQHEILTYTFHGTSMMPMLVQGKDMITVKRRPASVPRCCADDVVLYKSNGRYVLHRIVEVRENDYVIIGDNCVNYEYGITDDMILGQLIGFTHGGVYHTVQDADYLRYVDRTRKTREQRIRSKKMRMRARQLAASVPGARRLYRKLKRKA